MIYPKLVIDTVSFGRKIRKQIIVVAKHQLKMRFVKISQIFFAILLINFDQSSSSPTANDDPLSLLAARFDSLQAKMDQLVIQLEEEKTLRSNLQAMNEELYNESQKQRSEIEFLMSENIKQEKEILLLKNKMMTDSNHNDKQKKFRPTEKINDDFSSPRLPPSSCRQLSTIGHYLEGIYLVANPDTRKIETVYCDFESGAISETLFGNVDVKRKSINFYVQRNGDFALNNTIIPFEVERLNVGGAMNTAAGVFTVPVDGIYHFEFSALKEASDSANVYVRLLVNGQTIGLSFGSNVPGNYVGLSSINAHLRLKTGDQISVFKDGGTIHDDNAHYTHFSGWLVEEELVKA